MSMFTEFLKSLKIEKQIKKKVIKKLRKTKVDVRKVTLEVRFINGRNIKIELVGCATQEFNCYREFQYGKLEVTKIDDTWKNIARTFPSLALKHGIFDEHKNLQFGEIITIIPKSFEPHEIEVEEYYYEN